jgi:exodeoxyribonuclease-5
MVEYTDEQLEVMKAVKDWWKNSDEQVFQYAGYPGTGKTFILHQIIKELGIDMKHVAPMAYIGQAAINMRVNGLLNARTIHSWVYDYTEVIVRDKNGKPIIDEFYNRPKVKMGFVYNEHAFDGIKLIIIDEAGSVPMSLKSDIEAAGVKIIATGDLGQLPPPCDKPAYLTNGKIYRLTKIMRQKGENNGILELADLARLKKPIKFGKYGDNCIVIPESALTLEHLKNAEVFICATNKTRDKYNTLIREKVYGRYGKLPEKGDILVCRKNDWSVSSNGINLANGLRGVIANYPDMTLFDGTKFTINFKPDRLDDCYFKKLECDYRYLISDHQTRMKIKSLPYGEGHKFEYGYAITTHMAQGAQYDHGIYYAERFGDLTSKLNFTGITRFKKSLIYVIKQY